MRTFFVSSILLLFLFLGIFIGIQYAEYGIREVQGKDGPPQAAAVAVNADGEPVDVSLLGKTFSGRQWAEMSEQTGTAQGLGEAQGSVQSTGQIDSGNVYADIGTVLGSWVQQGVRGLVEWVLGWLDRWM